MSSPRERPLIFSGPMVRALLAGTKSQTRRVVMPPEWLVRPDQALEEMRSDPLKVWGIGGAGSVLHPRVKLWSCPYGRPGDRLWLRETWREWPSKRVAPNGVQYAADIGHAYRGDDGAGRWRPSIFMPRWASRLTLQLTGVRVERLQDISEEDAKAEGCEASELVQMKDGSPCYSTTFQKLWRNIHGIDNPAAWDSNPWCWCLSFRRAEAREVAALRPTLHLSEGRGAP